VDVMMQQIPEASRETSRRHGVVVCSEDGRQLGVAFEVLPHAHESVPGDHDVGVDEHDQLGRRSRHAKVSRSCRAHTARLLDDDHFVRRLLGRQQRVDAALEGRR
jgi:hypothetical protein